MFIAGIAGVRTLYPYKFTISSAVNLAQYEVSDTDVSICFIENIVILKKAHLNEIQASTSSKLRIEHKPAKLLSAKECSIENTSEYQHRF